MNEELTQHLINLKERYKLFYFDLENATVSYKGADNYLKVQGFVNLTNEFNLLNIAFDISDELITISWE